MRWEAGFVQVEERRIFLAHDADPGAAARPRALLLHGALGNHGPLVASAPAFAERFRVVLADLPGHGRSSPSPGATVEALAADLTAAVLRSLGRRPLYLIGESFGGLVALAMAPQLADVAGVALIDPPFTTAKQWHVGQACRDLLGQKPPHFLRRFCEESLGFDAEGMVVKDLVYYGLLDAVRAPVLAITGTEKLGLPRPLHTAIPCCMDETDLFVLERLYGAKVAVHREAGADHILLRRSPERCLEIMRERLSLPA